VVRGEPAPAADLVSGAERAVAATTASRAAEDAALVARIANGDSDAFAQLYRRYFRELYDFAARITRDREAAADIVQSVFAAVWARLRNGEKVRSPRAWLYRVTRNAAIDEIRRRARTTQPNGDAGVDFAHVEDVRSPEPVRAVIDKELADLVWSTAAVLSPDDYSLLDLHVRRGLSADELAAEFGISTGAVHTRLSRLRRSFEDALTVTLLRRRGGDECDEFADLVSELGARVDTPEGNKLLRAHVRDCATCRANRRRFVTAAEVLAGIAPVPLLPGAQDAVWSNLSGAVELGGPAGDSGKPASGRRPRSGASASGSGIVHAALAHPVAVTAVALAIAALVAVGVWAVGAAPPEAPSPGTARDPSLVWSPTHSPGERSRENVISIRWSRQPDARAYSVLWSQAPTQTPDAVPDLPGSATGTTSPALAPGRWYFHLRTQGYDGSWTHTVHRGPFVVISRAGPRPDSAAAARPRTVAPPESAARSATDDSRPPSSAGPAPAAPERSSPRSGTMPSPATPAGDSTPPSGQAVELADGPYHRRLAVPLVLRHGVDRESGVDRATGVVERQAGVLANGSCERWGGTWRTVELERSTDATVADGRCYRYRYRIADRAGNRSAVSKPSAVAVVDATPPSPPALSLSENGAHTFVIGGTIFIRPGEAGGFAIEAASVDDGSGVAAIEFPAVTRNGAPTRRTAAPYQAVYTWSSPTVAAGAKTVISRDRAGNTASARFTVTLDADPPTGMTATLAGGPWFAAAVPVRIEEGSDAGSGVHRGTARVERQSASLQAGTCGSFTGAWEPISLQAGADAGVQHGTCHRYRVSVSDNVGNWSSSPASQEARIDTTAPSRPRLTSTASAPSVHVFGTTVFSRPGAQGSLTVAASTADDESGVEQVLFPTLAGAAGGGIDDTAPYAADYTWTQALTAAGANVVAARNRAGLVSDGVFTMIADGDPPTGMSVTLLGGPTYPGAAVPFRIDQGSDAGSGVDRRSATIERDSAPMTPEGCGAYSGVWTPLDLPGTADTTVVAGNCYRYRVSVADYVGNWATSPPTPDARVR
jgi:RNA polymerase sigma factor (sigma-70 family)